jgi:hypothetical protein
VVVDKLFELARIADFDRLVAAQVCIADFVDKLAADKLEIDFVVNAHLGLGKVRDLIFEFHIHTKLYILHCIFFYLSDL